MAVAIEHCNLHKRISLKVLLMVGTSPRRLLFGFMVTTMFLSMWICNAAATAMMTPIVTAVLDELKAHEVDEEDEEEEKKKKKKKQTGERSNRRRPTLTEPVDVMVSMEHDGATFDGEIRRQSFAKSKTGRYLSKEEISYFLGIAYAANIGGTGTITGSATNLTFKGIFESLFPLAEGLNFATWMQFNVPLMALNTFLGWLWLQMFHNGLFRRKRIKGTSEEYRNSIRGLVMQRYEELGPLSYHEINVLCLFLVDVLLWFFRKPEFVPGWASWFPEKVVKDATPAIAVVLLLFILPANLDFLKWGAKKSRESPSLLSWRILHEKIPFGIILLLGGGFAVSKASETSGLSNYIGQQLEVVKQFSPTFILSIVVVIATFATEVSSNTAVVNILLPVLAKMCRIIKVNPLYLMLPATVCSSYAFMLPVATPPNAIVMAVSNMKTSDMIKAGIGMNLICAVSLTVSFIFIGAPMYGYNTFPEWAGIGNTTHSNG
ncbi:hypothetical protein RUM43_008396 [Polyplax serrata]|uniref:Uncharacterized protein n=1 Tax=Polyplax serrata TaxID=468196 RepID=A0AAN8P326_POLSC